MLETGGVLHVDWDERLLRVMMTDPIETFYDVLSPSGRGWGLERARTATYYRIETEFLARRSSRVRSESLTEKERTKHRPDLPMRLLQSKTVCWSDQTHYGPSVKRDICVNTSTIALIPFGAKGAPQKPRYFESLNGTQFTGVELLNLAKGAQETSSPEVSGIGMYRSGICRGVPSYYLWGATDLAGHIA